MSLGPGDNPQILRRPILTVKAGTGERIDEVLAAELPFRVRLDGELFWDSTSSPGLERELAMGRLRSEGVVLDREDILELRDEPGLVQVRLAPGRRPAGPPPLRRPELSRVLGLLPELMRAMQDSQELFPATGCAHCASLYDANGEQLGMAEDVARHNALDKAVGIALLSGALPRAVMALTTSRLSGELVSKCSWAGVGLLAGVSAATSQAVDMADKLGLILIGRLRGQSMQVYSGFED